jgi:hypothetical protein
MPTPGDLVVDGKWLFEVGGKNKGFKQIKGIEDSYVVSDGINIGYVRLRHTIIADNKVFPIICNVLS